MAKVVVEYDTVAKSTMITVDGEAQDDVEHIEFNYYENMDGDKEGHMRMVKRSKDKDQDMHTTTIVSADHKPRNFREKLYASVAQQLRS